MVAGGVQREKPMPIFKKIISSALSWTMSFAL
jgi:hypothetical protein